MSPAVSSLAGAVAHAQEVTAGAVTIEKDARPNGPRNFPFTTDLAETNEHGLDNFSLDDDPSSARPSTQQYTGVVPGTYFVAEAPVDGWELTDISCTGGTTSPSLGDQKVVLTVAAGDDIHCTFVNERIAQGGDPAPIVSPTPSETPSQPLQDGSNNQGPAISAENLGAAGSNTSGSAPAAVSLPARLPRTGWTTGILAAIGMLLIGAGVALLRSRRSTDGSESSD